MKPLISIFLLIICVNMSRNFSSSHDQSFDSKFSSSILNSSLGSPLASRSYSSPLRSATFKNTSFDRVSYIPLTPIVPHVEEPHSATSVISAFRELQAKSKGIEWERSQAVKERDELKATLSDNRRRASNERSKFEMEVTEDLLRQKAANDRLRHDRADLESKVTSEEEISRNIDRGIRAEQTLMAALKDDCDSNDRQIESLEKQIALQREELAVITKRTKQVNIVTESHSPKKNKGQYKRLYELIESLETQINKVNNSAARSSNKFASLQRYVETIVKINGELVDTLISREQTRARVLRLSGQLTPRYAWPKEVPYTEILGLVNDAAVATATGIVQNSALKASEEAIKTVISAISPVKHGYGHRSSSASAAARGRSVLDPEESFNRDADVEDWLTKLKQRKSRAAHDYLNKSTTSTASDRNVSVFNAERYRPISSVGYGIKLTKQRKPKSKKGKKSRAADAANSSGLLSSQSFLSAGPGLTTTKRRNHTKETAIARQSAISNATRFAAAATAAATTSAVHNTPSHRDRRSPSRERSPLTHAALMNPIHGDGVQSENRASFIPTGGNSNEFNVVASVSKANRAVKQLNATVASR